MNESELDTVIAGNFQRSCRAGALKGSERILSPENVRQKRSGSGLKCVGEVPGGMLPGTPETENAEEAEEAKTEDDRAVSFWKFAGSRSEDARQIPDCPGFIPGKEYGRQMGLNGGGKSR